MASSLYKGYMRICEKWKIDPSKKGRDLGEFIRQQVFKEFSYGEASKVTDLNDCERKLRCLNRLVNNHYGNQYKRKSNFTASALTLEECKEVLSTKSLEALKEKQIGLIDKIRLKFLNQRNL